MRILVVLLAALAGGCATYSHTFQPIERALAARQPALALQEFEKRYSPGGPDNALYHLNHAMLLRLAGRYADSNAAFEKAKVAIEKVEALSLTESAASVVVSDNVRSYEGEDFEKVLLHLYSALNYLDLGQPYDARVEILQVDTRIQELASRARTPLLTEEAFARYLSGIVYESLGEFSDALISYRMAYESFTQYRSKYGVPVPESLKLALLRLAEHQGIEDEVRTWRGEFGIDAWDSTAVRAQRGEIVVTLHAGQVAKKQESAVTMFDAVSGRVVRIAVPVYQPRYTGAVRARIVAGDATATLELVDDVDGLAAKSLQSHIGAITARTFARAVVKYRAAREAEKNDPALGLLVNIATLASERADTRSWSTLPAKIYLGRLTLPPGDVPVKLELLGAGGQPYFTQDFGLLRVVPGKTEIRTVHYTP